MSPQRIQLRRSKGWRKPPDTVKVDRASGFGNPFRVSEAKFGDGKREWWVESTSYVWRFETRLAAQKAAVDLYRASMSDLLKERVRLALKGKNLACWCKPGEPCHADVLLEIANGPA